MKIHLLSSVRTLAVLSTFGAAAVMTLPAHAISPQADTVSIKIDTRDLRTDRGVEHVYKALARKAKNACDSPGTQPISEKKAAKACAKSLLQDFVEDVDSAKLTSYYQAQKASA